MCREVHATGPCDGGRATSGVAGRACCPSEDKAERLLREASDEENRRFADDDPRVERHAAAEIRPGLSDRSEIHGDKARGRPRGADGMGADSARLRGVDLLDADGTGGLPWRPAAAGVCRTHHAVILTPARGAAKRNQPGADDASACSLPISALR